MWLTSSTQPISTTRSPLVGSRPVVSVSKTISRIDSRDGKEIALGGKGPLAGGHNGATAMTTDQSVLNHIERLTEEEHRLYEKGNLSDDESERLRKLNIELDQCWDLLRQRRAKREFGENPDEAETRPTSIVEKYEG